MTGSALASHFPCKLTLWPEFSPLINSPSFPEGVKAAALPKQREGTQHPPWDVWGGMEAAPPAMPRALAGHWASPLRSQLGTCFQLPVKSELEETY